MHTQGDPTESLTCRSHAHVGSGPYSQAVFAGAVTPRPLASWHQVVSGFCLDPLVCQCAVCGAREGLALPPVLSSPRLPRLHGSRAEATELSPTPLQCPWLRPAPDLLTWAVGQGQHARPPSHLHGACSGKQGLPSISSAVHAGRWWWLVPWEQGGHPSFPPGGSFLPAHKAGASRWILKAPCMAFSWSW